MKVPAMRVTHRSAGKGCLLNGGLLLLLFLRKRKCYFLGGPSSSKTLQSTCARVKY